MKTRVSKNQVLATDDVYSNTRELLKKFHMNHSFTETVDFLTEILMHPDLKLEVPPDVWLEKFIKDRNERNAQTEQ